MERVSIQFKCYPGGRRKAVTFSFDDGRTQDRRLVETMNRYGLKGTFHLNSGKLGQEGYIDAGELAGLFAGHEVSAHTINHPFLDLFPTDALAGEIWADRQALERLTGYPVRGMSYPFGTYDDRVVAALPAFGIEYARTIQSHGGFELPADFLRWHPTCHHKQMVERTEDFLGYQDRFGRMSLLYIWGHSYEFDSDDNWQLVDAVGEMLAGADDVWKATNAEIVAYKQAIDRLRFSADCTVVHNPSALEVWIAAGGEAIPVGPGELKRL
ncbi:polysaccharide deacetylase family protein [Cohnella ginsengisoli]|uniref:Polysaccharide deacetylase family protein n=1 Tax=Cohnella ginsengisoli TaxID=425004 RepID=A0A9X4KIZ2_9BACL|nr:polysaccharide deacetylase family protein [Cohnella ginsengisoli]MDG0791027.1 polysaccharide deacetylase family protein [Cohnella ginsengisoli]